VSIQTGLHKASEKEKLLKGYILPALMLTGSHAMQQ